ncbi:MAG: hypothetical protein AB1Z98_02655 [Nannocystaceae bacterium]
MPLRAWISLTVLGLGCACTRDGTVGIVQLASSTSEGPSSTGSDDGQPTEGGRLDLATSDPEACLARGESPVPCTPDDRPDSFEAVVQWEWTGPDGNTDTLVIPLVANLTDDDGNGRVDLCDGPDIVVVAGPPPPTNLAQGIPPARLYALDGATGARHWTSERPVRAAITPALGDIDGDGDIEIVTLSPVGTDVAPHASNLIIFESDGRISLLGDEAFDSTAADAVALADLDADGFAEIMVADRVFDHTGQTLFVAPDVGLDSGEPLMPFGVDLDDDGDLEVLWARAAYHHDGTPLFANIGLRRGYAQVADLDGDPEPEIVMTTATGLAVVEADGTIIAIDVRPVDLPASSEGWRRPAAIHDIGGDARPEVLLSAGSQFLALRVEPADGSLQEVWTDAPAVVDAGWATGTAFDFLGDGTAEAIYADEHQLYAFDETGAVLLMAERSSITLQEYPVVADVDDDGSAEIVVGSNAGDGTAQYSTLTVYGEADDRWVQARRIWNQHTYHVTNVGEDGSLPAPERPHWRTTNTFRTNAQLEDGMVCVPVP